jgi:hypothetical protein
MLSAVPRDVLVRHLAEDPAFAGIGYATAGRLWEAFGADLSAILGNGEIGRLEPLLGVERAEALIEAWRNRQAEGDIVVWLAENGFDGRLARKVLAIWGADAPARLRNDPWMMLAVSDFATVDAATRRLGLPVDAEARRFAAVEAVLYRRLDESHTWTGQPEVEHRVADLLCCSSRQASEAVSKAIIFGAVVPGRRRPANCWCRHDGGHRRPDDHVVARDRRQRTSDRPRGVFEGGGRLARSGFRHFRHRARRRATRRGPPRPDQQVRPDRRWCRRRQGDRPESGRGCIGAVRSRRPPDGARRSRGGPDDGGHRPQGLYDRGLSEGNRDPAGGRRPRNVGCHR